MSSKSIFHKDDWEVICSYCHWQGHYYDLREQQRSPREQVTILIYSCPNCGRELAMEMRTLGRPRRNTSKDAAIATIAVMVGLALSCAAAIFLPEDTPWLVTFCAIPLLCSLLPGWLVLRVYERRKKHESR